MGMPGLTGKALLLIYFSPSHSSLREEEEAVSPSARCQPFISPVSAVTDVQALVCPSCGLCQRVMTGCVRRERSRIGGWMEDGGTTKGRYGGGAAC